MAIRLICLDADDTLWHNEAYFQRTRAEFAWMLEEWADKAEVEAHLDTIEHRNLRAYGYGAKGFVLSMVETAVNLSRYEVPAALVCRILTLGKDMLTHPVEMLDGVAEALAALAKRGRLVLLTKGDLWHQEAKLAASGLGERFTGVEIVSDKKPSTYARVFERYGVRPDEAVMAGNSMRSDILPALEAGAWAAYVPFEITWTHETAEPPAGHARYRELASLAELPEWIDSIGDGSAVSWGATR
jgi:putative hydrolase of the HAD superfamily